MVCSAKVTNQSEVSNMEYPNLFTPGRIGPVTVKNRLVMTAMCVGSPTTTARSATRSPPITRSGPPEAWGS